MVGHPPSLEAVVVGTVVGVGGVRLKRRSASLEPDPLLREGEAPRLARPRCLRLGSQTHAGPHVVLVPLEGVLEHFRHSAFALVAPPPPSSSPRLA